MVTKKIVWTDLDGNQVTQEVMFHLNKLELLKLDAKYNGLVKYLESITKEGAEDSTKIIEVYTDIMSQAYGFREGDRFVKDPEKTEEFINSDAFAETLYAIATTPEEMERFMYDMIPSLKSVSTSPLLDPQLYSPLQLL